jgi:hypothetical protein
MGDEILNLANFMGIIDLDSIIGMSVAAGHSMTSRELVWSAQQSGPAPGLRLEDLKQWSVSIGSEPTATAKIRETLNTENRYCTGSAMGPKLRETSVKYVNMRPEMIENARAGKVN